MRLWRIVPLLSVLIAPLLTAQLGVETPVSPEAATEILPAAFSQSLPVVASNGRSFLAVWVDQRNGAYALYAIRLDGTGRPVVPFAQRIADDVRTPPVITADADGRGYVIAWYNPGALTIVRVDEDGRVIERIAPPRNQEFSSCDWKSLPVLHSISTNGSTHVVWAEQYCYARYGKVGFVRNAGGTATMTMSFGVLPGQIETDGSSFTTFGFDAGLVRTTVDPQGAILSSLDGRGTMLDVRWFRSTMALAPDRLLIAGISPGESATTPGGLTYLIVDRDGNVLHPMATIPVPVSSAAVTNAFWDGVEFLVTLSDSSTPTLSALRISADGALLTPKPIVLSTTATGPVAIASDGTALVLLWRDTRFSRQGDIVSRAVPNFAALANPSDVQLVTYSARAQANVRVATTGQHRMFVWNDGQEVGGRLDDRELRIGGSPASSVFAPSIAASERAFLVAWTEANADGTSRLMARRYATDGTPLDPQPQLLAADLVWAHDVGIGSDGSSFLVVCASRIDEIVVARVDATGTFTVARHHPRGGYPWTFTPLWLGSHWLVPYLSGIGLFERLEVSPDLGSIRDIGGAFSEQAYELSVVLGGENRIAYAWRSPGYSQIRFAQTLLDGPPVFGPIGIASGYNFKPALAWTGSRYLLAWTDRYDSAPDSVKAIGLTVYGALDATAIEVTSADVIASAPSIARFGSGAIIAYSREDASQTGVVRAFFRTHSVVDIPRRPAVRH